MPLIVTAVFASALWVDQSRLRIWAKQTKAALVLLTDDATDANVVLARQLRCSAVVAATVRVAGTLRSVQALTQGRAQRDEVMLQVSDEIVVFAQMDEVQRWESVRAMWHASKPFQIIT